VRSGRAAAARTAADTSRSASVSTAAASAIATARLSHTSRPPASSTRSPTARPSTDSGELQQVAPPLECYNEPDNLFVAGFIGSPSMNFVEGEIAADGFASKYTDVPFDPADNGVEPGQRVTLGFRPEDVHLERNEDNAAASTGTYQRYVDVLEPMGDEMFVYLLSEPDLEASAEGRGEGQTLMSVGPEAVLAEEEPVGVVLDRTKIRLFDTDTGEAIVHGLE